MKKYWKFTAIIAVIVLSIGTFYVNSATSAEQYPEFVIQTQSGDAEEIKTLQLDGSYTDTSSMNYMSTNVKISAEGSTYSSRSFLDQIIGQPPTVIKELQEEYRTFMRGKSSQVSSFFENEQVLAYADIDYKMGSLGSSDFKLNLSVLSKEDGNRNSFTVEVPEGGKLEYAYVEDVQVSEDELYLITQNMIRNPDGSYDEKHIYTIDLENQKISNDEVLSQAPKWQEGTHMDAQIIRTSPTTAHDYIIFLQREVKVIEEMESFREEVKSQEIISYNLATKEKEAIKVPDLRLDESHLSFFDGTTIYFMVVEGQELVVTPYHLVDDQVGQTFNIQLSKDEENVQFPMITIKDGKLYVTPSQISPNSNADVIVADVKTGETLFKGQIALENPSETKGHYELYMHEMFVK